MDEEDLAEAEEARKIQTTAAFAGLGSTEDDVARTNSVMGLFHPEGDTMGARLLRKMGWRDGQGIGPKVRRKARLDMESNASGKLDTFLFAPENVPMVGFVRKTDHKGLGFSGESRLGPARLPTKTSIAANSEEEEDNDDITGGFGRPKFSLAVGRKKGKDKGQGGIGTGILNDNGSDDEDPYEIGPRISYNRTIGGDKKKKKATTAINPNLKAKPTFMPKKSTLGKVGLGVRKCHDGRLPLEGFVFGREDDPLISAASLQVKYPPPKVPPEWKSAKTPKSQGKSEDYVSTADAAKASTLDPKARAALLGEKQLPGKSVFDFMSAEARQRLVAVTGKADLPAAKGEIPAGYARTEEERQQELLSRVPNLDKETSVAALSRGTGGGAPYADNDEKRSRYRAYLEHQAGFRPALPTKPAKMSNEDWLREFQEFFNCARIFKPMTGFMATRFTTASSTSKLGNGSIAGDGEATLLAKPPPKPKDPAEEAAKLGMYGPLTRSVVDFYPTRLLCKRFNVKPPPHVQPDDGAASGGAAKKASASQFGASMQDYFATEFGSGAEASGVGGMEAAASGETGAPKPAPEQMVDSTKNEALEGARAGEEVFKAIFGDSDDEDD
jgi:G patch domain-containing protein 1